jgi:hypothetical protein
MAPTEAVLIRHQALKSSQQQEHEQDTMILPDACCNCNFVHASKEEGIWNGDLSDNGCVIV